MTDDGHTCRVTATGPFEAEHQVLNLPAVKAVYEAFRSDPGAGKMGPHNRRILDAALEAAGVPMGAYDNQIAKWLSRQWEPQVVAVIAAWPARAAAAERERITGLFSQWIELALGGQHGYSPAHWKAAFASLVDPDHPGKLAKPEEPQ